MPSAARSIPQTLVMAAIVTTALYVPVGALVALASALLGVPLHTLVTFAGRLGAVEGVIAWWAIFYVPALVYAAFVMP